MKKVILLLIVSMITAGSLSVAAATRYVTDQFKITMRSGESATHKIIRMLSSGTPVEVLSAGTSGYSRVRVNGKEGYVLTRQLMDAPAARERLAKMEARLNELQEAPGKLSSRLARLQDQYQKLQAAHKELQGIKRQLERDLESLRRTSANAVRIANERTELRKSVATLTRQVEDLKQQNRDLTNQTAQNWFLIGGGVIIVGIVLGLILPHLRFQRRKSAWGSL